MNDVADTGLGLTGRIKFGTANKSFGSGLEIIRYSLNDATSIGVDYRYAQQISVTGSAQRMPRSMRVIA